MVCTVSVMMPAWLPVKLLASMPRSASAMHSSAMLMRSPVVMSMSSSRPGWVLDTSLASLMRLSVDLPIALGTTMTSLPCRLVNATFSATARMRSGSATDVPPYFCTIRATGAEGYRGKHHHRCSLASMPVLHRALDETYPGEVRHNITKLTLARTAANACFRFAPAFLATIAGGLGISLDRLGVALAISELSGLLSTTTGSVAERLHRRTAMWVGLVGVAMGATLAAASTHVVVFTIALVVIAQSKVMFDLGLGVHGRPRAVRAAWTGDGHHRDLVGRGPAAGRHHDGLGHRRDQLARRLRPGRGRSGGGRCLRGPQRARRPAQPGPHRTPGTRGRTHRPARPNGGAGRVLPDGQQPGAVRDVQQLAQGRVRHVRHRGQHGGVRHGFRRAARIDLGRTLQRPLGQGAPRRSGRPS